VVSIGGGTRRLIAKLATTRAKPAGVHIVPNGEEQTFLNEHELADLPGVGPALVEELRRRGLVRVEDALVVQPEWLRAWLGEGRGAWLHRHIRGIDASEVDPRERRRSISAERTFHEDVDADAELQRRLLDLATSLAGTLRHKRFRAKTVTVKLRDFDFRTRQRGHTVPHPVESDTVIQGLARSLLADLRDARRVPVRLLGIGLGGLVPADAPQQLGLFSEPVAGETERERTLSRAVDEVRNRFGSDAVVPASLYEPRAASPRHPMQADQGPHDE
jgi:DNA polymerase-4